MLVDQANKILVTASNDLSIGFHSMANDRAIDKTVMKVEIDQKINDMIGKSSQEFFVADIDGTISKFTVRY